MLTDLIMEALLHGIRRRNPLSSLVNMLDDLCHLIVDPGYYTGDFVHLGRVAWGISGAISQAHHGCCTVVSIRVDR